MPKLVIVNSTPLIALAGIGGYIDKMVADGFFISSEVIAMIKELAGE
ncbi:MAG: hypothetical protein J6O70_02320 [Lachnospiraceae bacterium]|nr:hypothetical protein [Lachnospiraceae bacterium]